jgi:hypothetical protein
VKLEKQANNKPDVDIVVKIMIQKTDHSLARINLKAMNALGAINSGLIRSK